MTGQYSSNAQLAKDYLWLKVQLHEEVHFLPSIIRRIREAPIDIAAFYQQRDRSLAALCIQGIGPQTRSYLESILSNGREKTAEQLNINRAANIESLALSTASAMRKIPRRSPSE